MFLLRALSCYDLGGRAILDTCMTVLLTIRRLAAAAVFTGAVAVAQTAPSSSVPVATPDVAPVLIETGTAPDPSLEFKPVPKDPAAAAQEKTAASPQTPVDVPVRPPVPVPGGPKVIEPDQPRPETPVESYTVPPLSPSGVALQKPGKAYVLGPLDVVEVRVWNDPKLSGIFDIGSDGTISVPLVGPVLANGLTAAELTLAIRQRLSAVIIEPEVNVQVLRNNSKKFTILGGCGRTGEFPLVGEVTVLDALASCGGFREFANLKKIYVLRGTQQLKFNYREVIKGKHMEQNIALQSGDRIVVPDN